MSARQRVPRSRRSALGALTVAEKGELLEELLTARPDLREQAEALAVRRLVDEDRSAVADDVASALRFHDIDELNRRAGDHPDRGYVDPGEAADEILDEALQPFLDDLARRAELGMTAPAVEVAVGIMCGLYACRDAGSESLMEYSPDYPIERAADVVDRCAKLGVDLPIDDLLESIPEWSRPLRPAPTPRGAATRAATVIQAYGSGLGRRPGGRRNEKRRLVTTRWLRQYPPV
jgi:hypothetical protein